MGVAGALFLVVGGGLTGRICVAVQIGIFGRIRQRESLVLGAAAGAILDCGFRRNYGLRAWGAGLGFHGRPFERCGQGAPFEGVAPVAFY